MLEKTHKWGLCHMKKFGCLLAFVAVFFSLFAFSGCENKENNVETCTVSIVSGHEVFKNFNYEDKSKNILKTIIIEKGNLLPIPDLKLTDDEYFIDGYLANMDNSFSDRWNFSKDPVWGDLTLFPNIKKSTVFFSIWYLCYKNDNLVHMDGPGQKYSVPYGYPIFELDIPLSHPKYEDYIRYEVKINQVPVDIYNTTITTYSLIEVIYKSVV